MAQNITVTLTNDQVQHALASARTVYPNATNAELEAMLTAAATHGPGVYAKIGEWDAAAFREGENVRRKQALEEFEETFPPLPEPKDDDDDGEDGGGASGGRRRPRRPR